MSVLKTWSMCCPSCKDDSQLDISAFVDVRLTPDGSSPDDAFCGDTQWDEKSRVTCRACHWGGNVAEAETAGKARIALIASDKVRVTISEVVTYCFDMPLTAEEKENPKDLKDLAKEFFVNAGPDPDWVTGYDDQEVISLEPIE